MTHIHPHPRTFGEGFGVDAGLAEVDKDAEGLLVEARVEQRGHLVQGCCWWVVG